MILRLSLLTLFLILAAPPQARSQAVEGPCLADSVARSRALDLQSSTGLCLSTDRGPRLLVSSWYSSGPSQGIVALLAPDGSALDSIAVGREPTFDIRMITGEPDLEIVLREVAGSGPGAAELRLSILRVRQDSLSVVFALETGSWLYPIGTQTGSVDSSTVTFPRRGVIEQRGRIQALVSDGNGGYRPKGPGCLYHDRYEWNRAARRFELQGTMSTPAHSRCFAT